MKSYTEPQYEKRMFRFDTAKWASRRASEKSILKTILVALVSLVVTDIETCTSPRTFHISLHKYFLLSPSSYFLMLDSLTPSAPQGQTRAIQKDPSSYRCSVLISVSTRATPWLLVNSWIILTWEGPDLPWMHLCRKHSTNTDVIYWSHHFKEYYGRA